MARDAITTRVEGLEEARAALESVLRAQRAALPEVLERVGQQAVTEIRRRSPLLTGRLRRSYTYDVDGRGRWVEVTTNISYAPAQEFGTRFQSGTPHVRPGIEAVIPKVPALIAAGMAAAGMAEGAKYRGAAAAGERLARTLSSVRP